MPFQKAPMPSEPITAEHVAPMPFPETCMRVFTNSMGWVKFTAKRADVPPSAIDWRSDGLGFSA